MGSCSCIWGKMAWLPESYSFGSQAFLFCREGGLFMRRSGFFLTKSYSLNNIIQRARFLLVLLVCLTLLVSGKSLAQEPYQMALSKSYASENFPLSLTKFIDLVVERNQQIQSRDADLIIKNEGIKVANSIYEPAFVGGYEYFYNNEQNDAAQFASRNFTETYEQKTDNYQAGVEGLIITGGQYRVGMSLRETKDNIYDIGKQYRQKAYVNLTQPLLKNAGIETTDTPVLLAEGDAGLALQSYRQELLNVVGRATITYWELHLAQEKVAMRAESVKVANQILEDNRARYKTGKMAEIEVLEAESGVALRKALELEAQKQYVTAKNDALTMFAAHAVAYDADILANEPLVLEHPPFNYMNSVAKAFELRPEYLATHMKLSQENIRLSYAENQRWPELDLKASYGLNGLDLNRSGAWDNMTDDDYYSWSVGMELRIPLFGDEKSTGELAQVQQRKRKALLEMKAIEVALANAVSTTLSNIKSATEQAEYSASVAGFNSRLLEIELVRLDAGKSNSRLVLEKEEDSRAAKEAALEALVSQKRAILELEMAEGSLLSRYHKDVMEGGI